MYQFSKLFLLGAFFGLLSIFYPDFPKLSAYVVLPRSTADTTFRMNGGGDPATRVGLMDDQRSPEYLDDWWGVNDYYYSTYGIKSTQNIYNSSYNSDNPPYYPLPNTYYEDTNMPLSQYPYNATRYYRPSYPR